jgi:hypothetical protein
MALTAWVARAEGAAPKEVEEEEEEEEEEVEEPPCKTVMEQVDLTLRAQVRGVLLYLLLR